MNTNTSNTAIQKILGDFIQNLPPSQEYLILSFSPGSIPLRQRWRNNCLSADFLADYLSTFFLSNEHQQVEWDKQAEVKGAVSYIANELLENAMKYGVEMSPFPISIQIHLNPDLIIFQLTNSVQVEQTLQFQECIETLLSGDPEELYIAQLEKNALEEYSEESGLGLLTMLNDYGARLGWKFESLAQKSTEMAVTTMVQLRI
ncbi:ATP-binding protein [Waterburya agarophytonicola K14]|uniref:ATP-binding protein n=1 Tax=Waterburya agarophytonicola KI4 TaxID=2874699 RepID=A0A964FHC2_9CYAN|nr:ATP-binding protein [Waterburya agarophytonicola]MCC0177358.1 ATP-binding protein [Waterburya agarophytonicola KI4]